jgi:hypothetical protein
MPGLWIADRPALCLLMGAAALAFDFLFVLAVFWPRSRRVLVPAAVLFHLAILFTQNYFFLSMPLLLVFVDWNAMRRRSTALRQFPRTISSRLSSS